MEAEKRDGDDVIFAAVDSQTKKRASNYIPLSFQCKRSRVMVVVTAVGVCAVIAVGVSLAVILTPSGSTSHSQKPISLVCSAVASDRRFDCFPVAAGAEGAKGEEDCVSRGCCWDAEQSVKCYYPDGPRQVHLALTGTPSEMLVSWLELGAANDLDDGGLVKYGSVSGQYTMQSLAKSIRYRQSPHKIFRSVLTGLEPNVTYFYSVGRAGSMSQESSFVSSPRRGQGPNEVIIYGDMGYYDQGAKTGQLVINYMKTVHAPVVIHVGDISYADFRGQKDLTKDSLLWDLFFHRIEPIANSAPYMVCAGNHDVGPNNDTGMQCGVGYIYRFKMPSQNDTLASDLNCKSSYATQVWYSFDYGLVHWTAISTEHDFSKGSEQYDWLERDLNVANKSRDIVPFLFVYGHRPMYCSHGRGDCETFATKLRNSIESLLVKYQVDMAVWGHVHAYERTYPVINSRRTLTTTNGPVHLVVGMAGAEFIGGFDPKPVWSSHREQAFGYCRVHVVNKTAVKVDFVDDSKGYQRDSFWLTK